jgi:hypothetical protein
VKAEPGQDGSLKLQPIGRKFAELGFYFTVQDGNGMARVRYVASLKDQIHVYAAEPFIVRADHTLWVGGFEF